MTHYDQLDPREPWVNIPEAWLILDDDMATPCWYCGGLVEDSGLKRGSRLFCGMACFTDYSE